MKAYLCSFLSIVGLVNLFIYGFNFICQIITNLLLLKSKFIQLNKLKLQFLTYSFRAFYFVVVQLLHKFIYIDRNLILCVPIDSQFTNLQSNCLQLIHLQSQKFTTLLSFKANFECERSQHNHDFFNYFSSDHKYDNCDVCYSCYCCIQKY